MDVRSWESLKRLFEEASRLPAEEQAAFLEDACADDPSWQAELESLLAAAREADLFFESPLDAVLSLPHWSDDETGSAAPDPFIGRTVHQYRIDDKLGSGGMGVVYRAHDTRLDRTVALKFLPPHLRSDDAAMHRFLVEARAAAALDHPNVSVVHEIGEDEDGRQFIAMAYYEGETLKRKLERGPLPVDEALDYARQIAAGLEAAHTREIVHRDVKPGNVIVTPEGVAKVLDFGLAKLTDVTVTRTGTTLGTVAYMSPEQVRGVEVGPRTDLWSLGVVLYEMLTGERPFKGHSTAVVLHAIQHEDAGPPSSLRPGLPSGVDSVVRKALAKTQAARFATAGELAGALASGETVVEAPRAPVSKGLRRSIPRLPVVAWAGVAAVAVLTTLGLVTWWPSGSGGSSFGGTDLIAGEAAAGIAVVPFTVRGSGLEVWREGMVDLLSTSLDGVGGYRAIDSRTVLARWSEVVGGGAGVPDLETTLEVARRADANYLLTGSAVAIGGSVRLAADLYDVASGDEVAQGRVEGSPDEVLELVDRLSVEVMGAFLREGEGERLLRRRAASVTTSSLPALKAYLEGEALYRRSAYQGAVEAFERAVDEDSLFALAYYRLAEAYGWAGPPERARENIEMAARLADRLRPRDRLILAAARSRILGDPAGVEFARDAVHRYPDDPEAWYALGEWYVHHAGELMLDRSETARVLSRAVALDPTYPPYYPHLIQVAIIDRDSARAAELLRTYRSLSPESVDGEALTIALPLFLGDSNGHRKALEEAREADVAVLWTLYNNLNPQVGDPAAMEAVARAGQAKDGRWGRPIAHTLADQGKVRELRSLAEDTPGWGRAYFLWFIHRFIRPLSRREWEGLDEGLDVSVCGQDAGFAPLCSLVPGTLAADRADWDAHTAMVEGHRELANRLRAEGDSTWAEESDGWAAWLEAYGSWRRGSAGRAIELLESLQGRAPRGHVPIDPWIRWLLGELYIEIGRPDRAVGYFDSLIHSRFHYAYSRYWACELYDELGDAEMARAACEAFLRAWRDADPGLSQPQEVRAALARL